MSGYYPNPSPRIFVEGFGRSTREGELAHLFGNFGRVRHVGIIGGRNSYGIVTLASDDDVERILKAGQLTYRGRRLTITVARTGEGRYSEQQDVASGHFVKRNASQIRFSSDQTVANQRRKCTDQTIANQRRLCNDQTEAIIKRDGTDNILDNQWKASYNQNITIRRRASTDLTEANQKRRASSDQTISYQSRASTDQTVFKQRRSATDQTVANQGRVGSEQFNVRSRQSLRTDPRPNTVFKTSPGQGGFSPKQNSRTNRSPHLSAVTKSPVYYRHFTSPAMNIYSSPSPFPAPVPPPSTAQPQPNLVSYSCSPYQPLPLVFPIYHMDNFYMSMTPLALGYCIQSTTSTQG